MQIHDRARKKTLTARLRRVEGQLRGITEMIERGDECAEIAVQLSAVKSAVGQILGAFTSCAIDESRSSRRSQKKNVEEINRLLKLLM